MSASILNSIKKVLGIAPEYTAFDTDVLMHINSTFSILHQLGIGPEQGFMIEDEAPTWDDFIGSSPLLNLTKSYVYLRVKFLFDPPGTSFAVDAMEQQLREFEWRLNVFREGVAWVDPEPAPILETVLDGGAP